MIEMQDAVTLYKLIILYMLNQASVPMENAQISNFMLEKEYTNFFTIQSVIKELEKGGFILVETIRNRSILHIQKEGEEVLGYCINEISDAIKADVKEYLEEKKNELRTENYVIADYFETEKNEFVARCIIKDGNTNALEVNLTVSTEEEANAICMRWRDRSQDVYGYLVQKLLT